MPNISWIKWTTNQLALFAAFVLYGLFSSPTPDVIGWAEIAIGLCLVLAISFPVFATIFSGTVFWQGVPTEKFLTACFLVLLYPALMWGMVRGHTISDVLRDIIPLGYLFLPLFLYRQKNHQALLYGVLFTGAAFAVRFWPESGLKLDYIGQLRGNDELLYLTSSPAVMFTGLYFLFKATTPTAMNWKKRVGMVIISMVCLLTLAATLQRGALVLAALVVFFVFLSRILRRPHFLFAVVALVFIGGFLLGPKIADLAGLVWYKTLDVGDNARFAEWYSILEALSGSVWHYLLGLGWGAKVLTAASGYAEVRYTHMLGSYILLKTGILGLFAMTGYVVWLVRRIKQHFPYDPALVMAGLPGIILGLTLYPSFKMLCFGAMLTLIAYKPEKTDAA